MRLNNEKGIALITALMFTLLSLGIIMLLLQMISQNTKMVGAQKRYKTAVEASYGAVDLVAKDIIPKMFTSYTSATSLANLATSFSSLSMTLPSANCLQQKRTLPPGLDNVNWDACTATTSSAITKESPDMTFSLPAVTGQTGYIVYTKIIDTRCGGDIALGQACTNSADNPPGTELLSSGSGVTSSSGTITPQHLPAYYRIDVQGERAANPKEKANLSVLYAY